MGKGRGGRGGREEEEERREETVCVNHQISETKVISSPLHTGDRGIGGGGGERMLQFPFLITLGHGDDDRAIQMVREKGGERERVMAR